MGSLRRRRPHPSLPGHRPTSHTDNEDAQHANEVLDPSLATVLALFYDLRKRILGLAIAPPGLIAAQRARRSPT